jgi:hypothetical protein
MTLSAPEDKYSFPGGFRQQDRSKQAWNENGVGEKEKEDLTTRLSLTWP